MTSNAPEFRGDQINAIRVARLEDAGALKAIYDPYVAETAISFELEPPSASQMAERIERIGSEFPWLVYEHGGEVLGYAYASRHRERAAYRWSADTTVYVARGAQRRGIGRSLYERLRAVLSLQGFHCAFGGVTLPNAASVGLHEVCGYSPVGIYREVGFKLGTWHDVGWWGLRLNAPAPDPCPPTAFTEEIFIRAGPPTFSRDGA
ncbi:MAG: arsinothricin resistance N-acetyltransferase ArsN1 family B [Caulobacteraceae bacterium]